MGFHPLLKCRSRFAVRIENIKKWLKKYLLGRHVKPLDIRLGE